MLAPLSTQRGASGSFLAFSMAHRSRDRHLRYASDPIKRWDRGTWIVDVILRPFLFRCVHLYSNV